MPIKEMGLNYKKYENTMGVTLRKKKLNESSPINSRLEVNSIIDMLKTLYAEEILAWYQYYIVSKFMQGHERPSIAKFFDDTAKDELDDHANKLLKRISELGGDIVTICDINNLKTISKAEYKMPVQPYTTIKLLEDNIESEITAIQHYMVLADLTRDRDYTTYCLALDILADEEEHLRELQDFYVDITGHEYEIIDDNFLDNGYDEPKAEETVYVMKMQ